jgi:Chlorophyllase enzyme
MWTVCRPDDLGAEAQHALLIWANGGCLQNGTLYGQWLLEVASYGFVVVADGSPQAAGADPAAGGIRTMAMALDWIAAENERPCSKYYHKLDVSKVAVAGQSCGGIMSLGAAGDKRVTTAIIFNSGLFSPDQTI